jgi:hypothetical protein
MSYNSTSAPPLRFTRSNAARPRDLTVPRPASSAETSVDEDTADRLLVNGFSVPASPSASQPGAVTYARPTSSAFDSQSRSPSLSSSYTPPSRHLTSTPHSLQHSIATNLDPDFGPPSVALLRDRSAPPNLRPGSSGRSTTSHSYGNPFVDQTELRKFPLTTEKQPSEWPINSQETPSKKKGKAKKVLISLFLILLLLSAAMIPVGFFVLKPIFSKKASSSSSSSSSNDGSSDDSPSSDGPGQPNSQNGSVPVNIPPSAVGTVLDSSEWLDKTDFNLTYTNATVGGLSIMVRILQSFVEMDL